MTWEDLYEFEDYSHIWSRGCHVRISKKTIRLSNHFMNVIKEKYINRNVLLMFSKSNNAIVLRFTDDNNCLKVRKINKVNTISTINFFKNINIELSKYIGRSYEAIPEQIPNLGEAWVVYLDK